MFKFEAILHYQKRRVIFPTRRNKGLAKQDIIKENRENFSRFNIT
jgi:hypothetical protein